MFTIKYFIFMCVSVYFNLFKDRSNRRLGRVDRLDLTSMQFSQRINIATTLWHKTISLIIE